MEAPIIVKSIGRGVTSAREEAWNRAVGMTPQAISNTQAFNVMYPTHKSYYDDKKFFVFDKNYETMEKALVSTFEDAVDASLKNPDLKDVDDIKRPLPKLNVNYSRIPRVY